MVGNRPFQSVHRLIKVAFAEICDPQRHVEIRRVRLNSPQRLKNSERVVVFPSLRVNSGHNVQRDRIVRVDFAQFFGVLQSFIIRPGFERPERQIRERGKMLRRGRDHLLQRRNCPVVLA